ncbi:MAG TPA: tetratricopeptide repeat protein [Blastocatellia bacterium]|nr:tetratricopeptide repeat protein [Blastocatellia bacterium]
MVAVKLRWLPLVMCLFCVFANAQDSKLVPGKPTERVIAGGQTHAYQIRLRTGQFLRVVVEQKGMDVGLALTGPEGQSLIESDLTSIIGAREPISYEVTTDGNYQLVIRGNGAPDLSGAYLARLELKDAATEQDRKRLTAERLLLGAHSLLVQGKYADPQLGEKLGQALSTWKELNDRFWQAFTYNAIGLSHYGAGRFDKAIESHQQSVALWSEEKISAGEATVLGNLANDYLSLNQPDKARGCYEQELALRRELKDRAGEGNALNDVGVSYYYLSRYEKAIEYYELALAISRELKDRANEGFRLANLGDAYVGLTRYDKAVECYEKSVAIGRELKDRTNEGLRISALGDAYYRMNRYDTAVQYYEQALAISRELKDRPNEAFRLTEVGDAYTGLSRFDKAAEYYEQALPIRRELKDRGGEAAILSALGSSYQGQSRYEKALSYYEQALTINRELKNRRAEGLNLNDIGWLNAQLRHYDKSIEYCEQALSIARELKNRYDEGAAINSLANSYGALKQPDKAMEFGELYLAITRELKDRSGEAGALNNLANYNRNSFRFEKAIEYFDQALPIFREVKDRQAEALVFRNMGDTYTQLTRLDKAVESYEQALPIYREINDRQGEVLALGPLANVYSLLGRHDKALEYFTLALPINRDFKNHFRVSNNLNGLGNAYEQLGQYEKAVEFYQQALTVARENKLRAQEGLLLGNLAEVYQYLNRYDQAIDYAQQGLVIIRETKSRGGESSILDTLGNVFRAQKQYSQAVQSHEQALSIARQIKNRGQEATALYGLMLDWQAQNRPDVAIFFGKQVVNLYQTIRGEIATLDRESQQSFVKSRENVYRTLADLLIAKGRLPEAEQVIRMLKDEEYLDFIRRDTSDSPKSDKAQLTTKEADAEKRYREIADHVAELATERGSLADKQNRTPEEEQRLAKLDADLTAAGDAFQSFLSNLESEIGTSSEASSKAFALRESQGLMEDLRELGKGTVALYTLVGDDKYNVILTTPDFQKGYEYPIKGTDLNRKVLEFREVLQNPKLDPLPLAQELYKILVGPVAKDLKTAKAETLMWSLDGVLRYVPMAALHDGKQYMVEKYCNVVFTPASQARLKDVPSRQWKVLGLGVTKAHGEHIPALPGVKEEMQGIVRDADDPAGVLPGIVKLDEAFTEEAMLTGLRQRPTVVHVASHFQFEPGDETSSALLLGDGSFLSLAQIKRMPNVFGGVELLTLSACNTATGGSGANGKEVEGFGVLAQRQGAKAVIASLWPVADSSTKNLMQEFYKLREAKDGETKAEALREAQLKLLNGEVGSDSQTADRQIVHEEPKAGTVNRPRFTPDPKKPFAHPYYWAPFILIGNWK